MDANSEGQNTMSSGRVLITDREQEVIAGEADDVENLERYQTQVRRRLEQRFDRLEAELAFLQEHEPEIARKLTDRVCPDDQQHLNRLDKLERELADLRDEIKH